MRYDIEIKNKAIEYYLVGYSANQVSKIVGVNEATIRKWIKEKNIEVRENSYKMNHRGPKSMIGREDYFDCIDSFDKAYYLGWIMADGNVSITNGQYSLKIHIAIKDKELIRR